MREYRGGDRDHEYTRSHTHGSSSGSSESVKPKTAEEQAAERVQHFRRDAETAAGDAEKLSQIVALDEWRSANAKLTGEGKRLREIVAEREKDAATGENARSAFTAAQTALERLEATLAQAKEPRPKPPVDREIEVEPQITDRSANPNDVLAWAAGLNAGQRAALAARLAHASTPKEKDRDVFAIQLANYLAHVRILAPFKSVLAEPKRFNAAAYANESAAREAKAATSEKVQDAPAAPKSTTAAATESRTSSAAATESQTSAPTSITDDHTATSAMPHDAVVQKTNGSTSAEAHAPPDSEPVDAILRRMIESGEPDPVALATLDGTTRRALARRLETYRGGSGDELGYRFSQLAHGARTQILGALRATHSPAPTSAGGHSASADSDEPTATEHKRKRGDAKKGAEHEATAATKAATPEPAPAPKLDERDYRGPLTAAAYTAWNQVHMFEAVRNRLASVALPPPHSRLVWADAAGLASAFEHALIAISGTGMDLAHRLPELLYPVDVFATIDQHRDLDEGKPGAEVDGKPARGSREWNPIVGQALAIEFEASLRRSVPRMGLRYVAQADDYHGSVFPEMLVASSPLDLAVARLVCDSQVARFIPEATKGKGKRKKQRGPKDTDAKTAFKDGIRLLSLEWMGAHDPKLWNYLRVLDCPDATAEEVSAALYERSDGKNHTEYAYALVVSSPFVRVPPAWARNMPGAKEYAPAKDDDETSASNVLDLADSSVADEAARAQAGKPAAKLDMNALARTLANSEASLRFIGDQLGDWKLAHLVGPALRRVAKQKEAILATPTETLKSWSAVADAQAMILVEATGEIMEVLQVATGAKVDPTSPDAAPFRDVVETFGIAMGESHLAQTAAAQLAVARQKKAILPLVLHERALRENHDVAQQMAVEKPKPINTEGPQDPAATAQASNRSLEANLLEMRARAVAGDMPSTAEIEDASVATAEQTLSNRIVMLHERVGVYEAAVSASDEGMAKVTNRVLKPLPDPAEIEKRGALFTEDDYQALTAKLRAVQMKAYQIGAEMRSASMPDKLPPDPAQARAAIAAARKKAVAEAQADFAKLADADLEKMLDRAVKLIQDARINQMIVDIALMIGVSVVGGIAGNLVGGLVRGAMLAGAAADTAAFAGTATAARWAGGAANILVDAGIQATAQTGLFGDKTGLAFGENLISSLLTLGALRPIHTLTGELGALDDQAKGMWKVLSNGRAAFVHTGTFTVEMLVGAGASYVAARMVHGKPKNEEEATSWGLQGAAMAVGHFINRRLGPLNERLSKLGEHAMHLRKRADAQRRLGKKLEASGNTEDALHLLDEHTRLLKDEHALLSDPAFVKRAGLDEKQLDALRHGNDEALTDTSSQAFDVMKLRFHGLEPIASNGLVWAGSRESIQRVVAEGGLAVKKVHEDRAPRSWETEMGGREVRFVEIDATDLRAPTSRAAGVAGPDLHTHVMGVSDVQYFVDKLGNGKPSTAFDAVYEAISSDAAAQKKGAHGWGIAQKTREDIERLRASGAKPEAIEARARQGLTEMLAAGPTTPFDRTYPIRDAVVARHIDPGGGPFRNYTRDTMIALAREGVGYSEQSVGLGKFAEKFPEQMMKELHAELAKQGSDVDMRFLAMVSTTALGGKVPPKEASRVIEQVETALARGDVIGIDFAGPEKQAFTVDGMENFKELYATVSAASQKRGRSLVVRPHVGEGYNEGQGQAHIELARKNLEMVISTLESMGYSPSKAAQDGVIIRFGHAAHATPQQIERMAYLGVIAEANIGSNEITGAIARPDDHPLLYNLYYGVRTVLGTDAQGVMQTDRRDEYARAREQIQKFRDGRVALLIDGKEVRFKDLPRKQQETFSVDALQRSEDAYHSSVVAGDRKDSARH